MSSFDTDDQTADLAKDLATDLPPSLTYVSSGDCGITRKRSGKGFTYLSAEGERIADAMTLARIRALAIPPAWTKVWICIDPAGHIQATGRDGKGRLQYIYHPDFRSLREQTKFNHLLAFADCLPALREQVAADMARRGLPREKVLATVVYLLEATMIRVGNASYAKENNSFGLTTLMRRHVDLQGSQLRFHFKGKSGKDWRLKLADRRVARVLRQCQELPGQQLFKYLDGDGVRQTVSSEDVNRYLRRISGQDVTAKDFRTWTATVLAAATLHQAAEAPERRSVKAELKAALEIVAARLGNTPTICRKSYVHPEVIAAHLNGRLHLAQMTPTGAGPLSAEEQAVLAFLRAAQPKTEAA